MQNYDVVIIGAGVSGLFSAMQLSETSKRILIIDAGKDLSQRLSSLGSDIASNRTIDRYLGFGGLGLSEGKYNFTNDFGGNLADKIGSQQSKIYQHKVDELLCRFGAEKRPLYNTYNEELAKTVKAAGFKLLSTQTRHLGTELSTTILQAFSAYLGSRIKFAFQTQVAKIEPIADQLKLSFTDKQQIMAKQIIIATGRSGISWLESIAQQLDLSYAKTRLDLGFRIEMPENQLAPLLEKTIETKLSYITKDFSATTYCMNPKGRVITKYQDGLAMPDGQNCQEQAQSHNLNFTLFIPQWFSSRLAADQFLHQTISQINQQKEQIIAQRLGDIDPRFYCRQQHVEPTLTSAVFSDLSTEVNSDYLSHTLAFLTALEPLLNQPISGNTILYAMDSKPYVPAIETDSNFATKIANLYVIGDSSGITSSLSQAAASGLYVADRLG